MNNYAFLIFRGLQRPLEFLGIKGRFLWMAAATIGGAFLSFFIVSFLSTKLIAFLVMMFIAGFGIITIFIKQKQGLHSKKRDKSIYVYKTIYIDPLK